MRHLFYKNAFKKDFALMEKRGKNMREMSDVITLLRQDSPFPPSIAIILCRAIALASATAISSPTGY
jgi:hypothetical protein